MSNLKKYLTQSGVTYPDNTALQVSGTSFTYKELQNLAAQFAGGLNRLQITSGSKIALWLPKSAEAYISIFGSVEQGSAFIPIDLSTPAARVNYILNDAGAEVLICRTCDYRKLNESKLHSIDLVILVGEKGENSVYPACAYLHWDDFMGAEASDGSEKRNASGAVSRQFDKEGIAYIFYTSGSTGLPKGAAISHRAACAFIDWAVDCTDLSSADRVANQASLSFDLSTFDIFATLSAGATLVAIPDWPISSGYPFARYIEEQGISVWYSVPTVLNLISESQRKSPFNLDCLRVVIFAGEVFGKTDLVNFQRHVKSARLYNWYGATEINSCISHLVTADDLASKQSLPMGMACPFAKIKLVFDTDSDVGELFVAGESLMSGYVRNGRIRKNSFVAGLDEEDLYYATGDLVQEKNGLLRYHSRRDQMIKRNGYRIELGEIENNLLDHSGVEEVACVYVDKAVVVFAVPYASCRNLRESILRLRLVEKLPPYMRPDKIFIVDKLPKSVRGKVDRRKLKAIYRDRLEQPISVKLSEQESTGEVIA